MSAWTLSLSDLANQAEAFLEQVDKKTADSLKENEHGSEEEVSAFSKSISSLHIEKDEPELRSEGSHSSPEIIPAPLEVLSTFDSELEEEEGVNQGVMSIIELENKLMKQELVQLTEELAMLSNKIRSQQEKIRTSEESERRNQGLLDQHSRVINTLKERDSDMEQAIMAKDTQIGVLKVRLAETDAEVIAQKDSLRHLNTQLDMLHSDMAQVTPLQHTIAELTAQLAQEKTRYQDVQKQYTDEHANLQTQISELTVSLHTSEQQSSAQRRKFNSAVSELTSTKAELDYTKKELHDYKQRATRVLQSREKLTEEPILDSESVEILILERNQLDTQLTGTKCEVEELRGMLSNIEQEHSEELQIALEKCTADCAVIRDRDVSLEQSNQLIGSLKEDLFVCQRELGSVRKTALLDLKRKDEELETERRQRSYTQPSEGELQSKLNSLTEVLLKKQNEVELLNSEKNSLVLKLESLETVLLAVERKHYPSTTVQIEPDLAPHNSYANRVRLKEALNSIDKFSIRLGVFLKRYPAARLMVLGYMFLLHAWVMVVLLTYSPEVHND